MYHHHHQRYRHRTHFVFERRQNIAPIDFIFTSRKLLTFDIYFCAAVTRCDIYNLTDSMVERIQTVNGVVFHLTFTLLREGERESARALSQSNFVHQRQIFMKVLII